MSAVLPTATPTVTIVPRVGLLSVKSWGAVALALIVVAVIVPLMNLMVPASSALHASDYAVQLVAKIMCYAICALAMDLIWGYTGILSWASRHRWRCCTSSRCRWRWSRGVEKAILALERQKESQKDQNNRSNRPLALVHSAYSATKIIA